MFDSTIDLKEHSGRVTSETTLLTRAGIYQVLSTAFYPPQSDITEKLWTQVISNWKSDKESEPRFDSIELRLEYNRLFVGPNSLPCPPYESVYRKDRRESERGLLMGPSVLDVKKRYKEAGLDISKGFSDLPDHVSVELEFMCYLCDKEEKAVTEEDADLWRKREAEFWKIHLDPWIAEFSDRILRSSISSYYKALALFLREWIEEEAETTFKDINLGLKRL